MKTHVSIGLRTRAGSAVHRVLPPHVVFQHHEKQNGKGYPRGLVGNNRVDISDEPRTIHLYGSIAAVADIYDAFLQTVPIVRRSRRKKSFPCSDPCRGGPHREVLRHFLVITPVYPVGSSVRVTKGKYLHHFGIVSRLNPDSLERPVIRLVFDSVRKRIEPVELNLMDHADIEIVSMIL